MIAVSVVDQQHVLPLDRGWLAGLVRHVCAAEQIAKAKINVVLVDNATIQRLHLQFLGNDAPTDVITFPLSRKRSNLEAEIVISTDMAVEQAPEYGWSTTMEASLYVVHGLLHLCGYDDHDDEDADAMHQRQEALLRDYADRAAVQPSTTPPTMGPLE